MRKAKQIIFTIPLSLLMFITALINIALEFVSIALSYVFIFPISKATNLLEVQLKYLSYIKITESNAQNAIGSDVTFKTSKHAHTYVGAELNPKLTYKVNAHRVVDTDVHLFDIVEGDVTHSVEIKNLVILT
jgi:hypothetical protein